MFPPAEARTSVQLIGMVPQEDVLCSGFWIMWYGWSLYMFYVHMYLNIIIYIF